MGSYKIKWTNSSLKELKKLPQSIIQQIIQSVENLAHDPFPSTVRKLAGSKNLFRIRLRDYRIIYSVEKQILTIIIIRVGHRKDVYKK